jgi:hypothetical protein
MLEAAESSKRARAIFFNVLTAVVTENSKSGDARLSDPEWWGLGLGVWLGLELVRVGVRFVVGVKIGVRVGVRVRVMIGFRVKIILIT